MPKYHCFSQWFAIECNRLQTVLFSPKPRKSRVTRRFSAFQVTRLRNRRGDIDFRQNVLHVREKTWSKNGETQTWRPKTRDQRAIPMTPYVKAELQQLPRRNEWVFLAPASPKYPTGDQAAGKIECRERLGGLPRGPADAHEQSLNSKPKRAIR